MMRQLYTDSESRFMSKYPDRFPGGTFRGELPNFIVKCDWAQGTPSNDPKKRSKDDTTHRKLLQIVMKIDDSERMIALTREIKKKGKRQRCLRRTCIPRDSTKQRGSTTREAGVGKRSEI